MKAIILSIVVVILSQKIANSNAINITGYQSVTEDSKIVGGQPATLGQFPFQVSIIIGGSGLCGGSLISDREVLTAAHCTDGRSAGAFVVRAGSLRSRTGGQSRTVSQIRQHPQYNANSIDNDVAVLVLSSPVALSSTVGLATLAASEPSASTVCQAAGWGLLMEDGPSSAFLQYVDLPIVNRARCAAVYGIASISANHICAGHSAGGRDTCQGDSGSALVLSGTSTQVGIVSYGNGCARPNIPGVYTNVARYSAWIRDGTQPTTLCTGFLDICTRIPATLFCSKMNLICNLGNLLG